MAKYKGKPICTHCHRAATRRINGHYFCTECYRICKRKQVTTVIAKTLKHMRDDGCRIFNL